MQLRPDDADTRNDLGVVLGRLGRRGDAEAIYREAIRLKPDFPNAHNNLGNILRNRGRHDEAVACFREALRLRPNYPEAYNNLGITLRAQGKHDEAIANYQRALALRPTYAEAHNNMGFALAHRGKPDAAIMCYQQAIRLKAGYFEANHNLGNILSEQGRFPEAVAAYNEALRIRPDEARVLKCLAITLSRQDKFDDAIATFRHASRSARISPTPGTIWASRSRARASRTRPSKPIVRRSSFGPITLEVYNNMGNALRHIGQFDESVECYNKAIQMKPNYADAYNNFGIALSEMGRFRRGRGQLYQVPRAEAQPCRCSYEPSLDMASQRGLRPGLGRVRMAVEEAEPDKPPTHPAPMERLSLQWADDFAHHRARIRRCDPVRPLRLDPQGPGRPRPLRVSGEDDQAGHRLRGSRRTHPAGGAAASIRRLCAAVDDTGAGRHVVG